MESRQSEEPAAAAASSPMFLSMLTNLLRDALLASADQHPPSSSQLPANFCSALLQDDPSRLTGLPPQSCIFLRTFNSSFSLQVSFAIFRVPICSGPVCSRMVALCI